MTAREVGVGGAGGRGRGGGLSDGGGADCGSRGSGGGRYGGAGCLWTTNAFFRVIVISFGRIG